MKSKIIWILACLTLLNFNLLAQENCDSNLFKQLIKYNTLKNISSADFQKCQQIVNQLWSHHCWDFSRHSNGQNYLITTRTFEYGKICMKADPSYSVKAFIEYLIDNKNSADEQLSFF